MGYEESKKESGRRRWVVQEEGRGAKLGGVSVNRESGGFIFIGLNKLKAGLAPYSTDAAPDLHGR